MRIRRLTIVFLVLLCCLPLLSLIQGQEALPLPLDPAGAQSRASIELLTNTSFETDVDADLIPDGWTGKRTDLEKVDKVKCNKTDKVFAYSGNCAFLFKGNPVGGKSKLQQQITDFSSIVDGSTVTLSAYVDPRSAPVGSKIANANVQLSNGNKIQLELFVQSSDVYSLVTDTALVDLPSGVTITGVKVDFRYGEVSAKYFVDDASFVVSGDTITGTPSTATLTPTGTLPTGTATGTATITPTPTSSVTGTLSATPSPTPSNTPTGTSSPTPSSTPTGTSSPTPSSTPA